jgi:hypothetical protein
MRRGISYSKRSVYLSDLGSTLVCPVGETIYVSEILLIY